MIAMIDRGQRRDHAKKVRLWEAAAGRHTGPRTPEGKAKAAQRARKHGLKSQEAKALGLWLSSLGRLTRGLMS